MGTSLPAQGSRPPRRPTALLDRIATTHLFANCGGRIGGLGVVASLVLLFTSGPAAAAPRPISGKLTKTDYTVVALAANGKVRVV
jgi:hypothetical protein